MTGRYLYFLLAVALSFIVGVGCKLRNPSQLKDGVSESQQLAARVKAVLATNCGECHGKNSSAEGGFDTVDNLSALVTRGYVVPKNPNASKLFKRMKSKSMPPAGSEPRPSDTDINLIQQWIEQGASNDVAGNPGRKVLATENMYGLMLADLLSVRSENRSVTRYVTFQNILNALTIDGKPLFSDDEFKIYRKGFFKLLNSVSLGRNIVLPVEVQGSGGAVWRINLNDYSLSSAIWDRIMQTDPYRLEYRFDARKKLIEGTQSKFPEVRADWFVFVASIPPFYHEILKIPTKLSELEKQLQVNINSNISAGRARRMGFNRSGVSNFNRMIERHDLPSGDGAFWTSYDFGGTNGRKNLFTLPLGPDAVFGKEKSFEHDGGETIWNLPNGLQAYILTKADGDRIDVGPINIVSDPKRPDRQVINGLSCMHCHAEGIKRKDDEIRNVVLANKQLFNDAEKILALYQDKVINDQLFDQDQKRFAAALAKLDLSPEDPEPTLAIQKHFESEISGNIAAAEFGLTYDDFIDRLGKLSDSQFGTNKRDLAPLVTAGGIVKREVFAASFRRVAEGMGLLTESVEPIVSKNEFTCFADAFEKSSRTILRTVEAKSKKSEDDAKQKALITCRQLIEGLSLYDCRISETKQCERRDL